MADIGSEVSIKSLIIQSGKNTGRIKSPTVAHEAYNRIDQARRETRVPSGDRVSFFLEHGDNIVLIGQAGKAVALEKQTTYLEKRAERDPLTGLLNKQAYKLHLEKSLKDIRNGIQKSTGVLRIDLDHFSWVNDILEAHVLGDLFIQTAGRLLANSLRGIKDNGFRVGGDEFVAILRDSFTAETLDRVASRIHNRLSSRLIDEVLQLVLDSERQIDIGKGKKDREGTAALKEMLRGFYRIKENVDGRRDHFLEHGRGRRIYKDGFLNDLDISNFSQFDAYMKNKKTYSELTPSEQAAQRVLEQNIVDMLKPLFKRLTVSTGGMLITQENVADYTIVDEKVDAVVSGVKRNGGNDFKVVT